MDRVGQYVYRDRTTLLIKEVGAQNNYDYTCSLNFTLGGVAGSVSETIDAWVRGKNGDERSSVQEIRSHEMENTFHQFSA